MCFSRFCLLSDLTYVHCSTLDSEFDQIAAELEGAEREEKDEESGGEESAEVCGMRPSSEQSEYLKYSSVANLCQLHLANIGSTFRKIWPD